MTGLPLPRADAVSEEAILPVRCHDVPMRKVGNLVSVELESARVGRLLRQSILSGERRPGDRIIERDIAEELAVSRLPVREAIRALVSEGLLVARPRSWAVVRAFTERDIADIAEMRDAVEGLAFELAARRHTAEGLATVRRALEREIAAARAGDVATAEEAGAEFHLLMAELAGNSAMDEVLGMMRGRILLLFGPHDDPLAMAEDHARIYESLALRDVETLRLRVQRHLRAAAEAAKRRLAAQTDARGDDVPTDAADDVPTAGAGDGTSEWVPERL